MPSKDLNKTEYLSTDEIDELDLLVEVQLHFLIDVQKVKGVVLLQQS